MNFKEIDRTGTVEGFALVKACDKKTAKNGSIYLDMVLSDKSGEIVAKLWDFKDGIQRDVEVNTIVKIRGVLQQYNNTPQLRVDKIRPSCPSDNIDISDYVLASEYSGEIMLGMITDIVNDFSDEEIKRLVLAVLEEYGDRMLDCPAAYKLHHAMRGGLLYHTLSIVRLAQAMAAIYPTIDRDLLLAGAILHDVAKTEEYMLNPTGLVDSYTIDGMLIGHLVRGAMAVERIGREIGCNQDVMNYIEHMLISHHGEPEFGAAVRPLFLEAEILSQLDLLDARIYEIEKATQDVPSGEFSTRQWALNDRRFFNHGRRPISPTAKLDG